MQIPAPGLRDECPEGPRPGALRRLGRRLAQGPCPAAPVPPSPWRSGGGSAAPGPAWPSRCPPAGARPSRCRCPPCPRPGCAPGSGGRARSGCAARQWRGGPRCSTASSPTCPTCARWRGGCSASSATSTRESCRPLGRSAPSSSWSTCGRCRRSWRGSTSASMAAWRSSLRSRRRRRLTGTWTSCWRTWRSSAAPFRSCTWPRAPTPRTPRPDPEPGPAPGDPTAGPAAAAGPEPPHEDQPRSRHLGIAAPSGRGLAVPRPDDAISRRLGAGAMAAALWSQAEAEGWRRLLRAVTRLQACVRGYLVRKRFQSLRAAFEEVVLEIEGDLSQLQWRGRLLPRPVFIPEEPAQGKCSNPCEAAPSDKASIEKPQEELDASEPEQDRGCSSMNPTAQLLSEKGLSPTAAGDAVAPLNLEADADEQPEKGCSAPAGSKDWQNDSSVSSGLQAESLGACLEIPLVDIKELPRTRSGLQSYRNHLVMELLWLEQAIVSRKNFLTLKQRLGTPGGGQS